MNLNNLRNEIDAINAEIIALLGKRLVVTKEIAKVKRQKTLPVDDWEREKLQKQMLRELAKQNNLSPAIIEEMFTVFVNYSKMEMKMIMNEKEKIG
ncbi:MAG: chorismate mutase [Verrucomicrobia bacterium]|nr:chorismate mutase [Verrucomicrobiota bacterium]